MARGLTKRQEEVLDLIRAHHARKGGSPSLQELADDLGVSVAAAGFHVDALRKKGYVAKSTGKARGIELAEWEGKLTGVALVPVVEEGDFSPKALSRTKEYANAAGLGLDSGHEYFALRMRSDVLRNAAVLPGDLVIFRKTKNAANGDIVLASVEGDRQPRLRRWMRMSDKIQLLPECDNVGATSCQKCVVHGVVAALLRKYGEN